MDFRGSKSVFSKKQGLFFGGLGRSKKGAFFCAPNRICQNVASAGHRPDPKQSTCNLCVLGVNRRSGVPVTSFELSRNVV